jgi:Ala-tRNA(Pro) deacylase
MATPSITVFERICTLLCSHGVPFEVKEHEPTHTSEQSAAARGESLCIGGKALLLKCDDVFALFVIPADRKLDSKAAKQAVGARKVRFATKEELLELTGLVPGAVPPFGRPVFDFHVLVDTAVYENNEIAFNAGDLTRSIILKSKHHLRIANATIANFCQKP